MGYQDRGFASEAELQEALIYIDSLEIEDGRERVRLRGYATKAEIDARRQGVPYEAPKPPVRTEVKKYKTPRELRSQEKREVKRLEEKGVSREDARRQVEFITGGDRTPAGERSVATQYVAPGRPTTGWRGIIDALRVQEMAPPGTAERERRERDEQLQVEWVRAKFEAEDTPYEVPPFEEWKKKRTEELEAWSTRREPEKGTVEYALDPDAPHDKSRPGTATFQRMEEMFGEMTPEVRREKNEEYKKRYGYDLREAFSKAGESDYRAKELARRLFEPSTAPGVTRDPEVGRMLRDITTNETEQGAIVESLVGWTGRMLGAPQALALGFVEGVVTDKKVSDSIAKRVREGRGFMGGGYDLGEALADVLGVSEDTEWYLKNIGGFLGILADLRAPILLGAYGATTKSSQALKTSRAVGETFGIRGNDLLRDVVTNYVTRKGPTTISEAAVARVAADEGNRTAFLLHGAAMEDVAIREATQRAAKASKKWTGADWAKWRDEEYQKAVKGIADVDTQFRRYRRQKPGESAVELLTDLRLMGFDNPRSADFWERVIQPSYKRAILEESLTPAQKARLSEALAVSNDSLVAAVRAYVTRLPRNVRASVEHAISSATKRPSLPTLKGLKGKEAVSLLDEVARNAVQIGAASRIQKLTVAGDIKNPLVLLSDGWYVPVTAKKAIDSRTSEAFDGIKQGLKAEGWANLGEDVRIDLLPRDKEKIRRFFVDQFAQLGGKEGAAAARTVLEERLPNRMRAILNAKTISVDDYQFILDEAIALIAEVTPGAVSADEVIQSILKADVNSLKEMRAAVELEMAALPPESRGGAVEMAARAMIRHASKGKKMGAGGEQAAYLADLHAEAMGTIHNQIKFEINRNMAMGLSRDEANTKALLDSYLQNVDTATPTGKISAELAHEHAFDDFMARMYGGFEQVAPQRQGYTKRAINDGKTVQTPEVQDLMRAAMENPDSNLGTLKTTFINAAKNEDYPLAMTTLRAAHKHIWGRPLGDVISRSDVTAGSGRLATRRLSNPDAYSPQEAGLLDIYDSLKSTAPFFDIDQFTNTVSLMMVEQRKARASEKILSKIEARFPRTVPSPRLMKILAREDMDKRLLSIHDRFIKILKGATAPPTAPKAPAPPPPTPKAPPPAPPVDMKWFGGSKVVDDAGAPLVVYHGTPGGKFSEAARKSNIERERLLLEKSTLEEELKELELSRPKGDLGALLDAQPQAKERARDRWAERGRPGRFEPLDDPDYLRLSGEIQDIAAARRSFDRTKLKPLRDRINSIRVPPKRPEEDVFRTRSSGTTDWGYRSSGTYFTPDIKVAQGYARALGSKEGHVYAAYLSVKNPFIDGVTAEPPGMWAEMNKRLERARKSAGRDWLETQEKDRAIIRREILQKYGFDGEIWNQPSGRKEYIVFDETQIKIKPPTPKAPAPSAQRRPWEMTRAEYIKDGPEGIPLERRTTESLTLLNDTKTNPDKYFFHGTQSKNAAYAIEREGLTSGGLVSDAGIASEYAVTREGFILVFRKADFEGVELRGGGDVGLLGKEGYKPVKPVGVFKQKEYGGHIPYGARSRALGDPPENPMEVHGYLVQQAVREGKPIPREVLKDYPSLAAKAPPTPKAPTPKAAPAPVPLTAVNKALDNLFVNGRVQKALEDKAVSIYEAGVIEGIEEAVHGRLGRRVDTEREIISTIRSLGIKDKVVADALEQAARQAYGLDAPGRTFLAADTFKYWSRETRAAMPEEFWNLLTSNVREAVRRIKAGDEPRLVSGLDVVLRAPLPFSETGSIRHRLVKQLGMEKVTERIKEITTPSTERKLESLGRPKLPDFDPYNISSDEMEDVLKSMEQVKPKEMTFETPEQRAYRTVAGMVFWSADKFSRGGTAMSNLAKSGVLGGIMLPLWGYHMTNFLTAPTIIWSQLGGRIAASSFDPDALRSMQYLYSIRSPKGRIANRILFEAPNGKLWTSSMIADTVATRSISRSQISAEMSVDIMKDIASRSARSASGEELSRVRQLLRDANRYLNPTTGMNIWQEMAHASDTLWRTGVLTRALKEGRSVDEAVKMAREALFDYGRMGPLEKQTFGRFFWFWTFQRENMRSVMRNFIDNPSRALHLYNLSRGFPEDGEFHFETREWNQNRPFMMLVNPDGEARERYAVHGPSIPFVEGMSQIIGIMSSAAPLFDKSKRWQDRPGAFLEENAGKIAGRARPYIKVGAAALNLDVAFDRVEPSGTYVDPRLLVYFSSNPLFWDAFNSVVSLERVTPQPGESTMYDGYRYRIRHNDEESQRNWGLMKAAALSFGVERTMRDYARWWVAEREGEITGPELQAAPGIEQLVNLGVLRVSPDVRPRDLDDSLRQHAYYDLKYP